MNGALMNAVSRIAIAAAVGVVWSVSSASAADLGGNCCADLEERVAELEATTARKGNRKMSLTVSGQVNRAILYWNDGDDSDTYAGVDNTISSTRFIFSGSAKIHPTLTAGFEFMTEWAGPARTQNVTNGFTSTGPNGVDGQNGTTAGADGTLGIRTANWWLEDKTLGRVTVGRINLGGPVAIIDLGGVGIVAGQSVSLVGGDFFFRGGPGTLQQKHFIGPTWGGDRVEGIRYDSPTIGGFLVQATWGEDDVWSASLRYAGDFHGFRFAAGIGYQDNGFQADTVTNITQLDTTSRRGSAEWSGGVSLMHTASGIFVQGMYAVSKWDDTTDEDSKQWLVQGGISKNWFGLGATAPYIEYGKGTDFAVTGNNQTVVSGISSSEMKFYGLGIVQKLDAAAMELYLGWRHFDASTNQGNLEDLDLVMGGARIQF